MTHSVRDTGPWQKAVDVEVPADVVEAELETLTRRLQRRAALPGFRKGKAPLDMVRSQFAAQVEQDFLDDFIPRVANQAITDAGLHPVIPPSVHQLKFGPGQPLTFEVVVDVRPQVEARQYKGLSVQRRAAGITDEAVDSILQNLREESAVFADLNRKAEAGDILLLDSIRLDANGRRLASSRQKNLRLQLGAPALLPDLERGLSGAQAGEERTLDVTYPADYPNQDLAGKSMRYLVKVRKIQEKKLKELDDNFAREVFQLGTLEELRERVRANLEGEERTRIQRELDAAVSEQLVQRNSFDLPERLEQWMLQRVIQEAVSGRPVDGTLREELETRYRPGVQRSLRRELLLEAIARQESLTVSDEEVAQEIDRMAQSDPRQAARVRARYASDDRRQGLRDALLERKAMNWVIDKADIQELAAESPLAIPAGR